MTERTLPELCGHVLANEEWDDFEDYWDVVHDMMGGETVTPYVFETVLEAWVEFHGAEPSTENWYPNPFKK